ncbi:hypothetical protein V6Z11_A05G309000 [Gossypium hirsutum]
MFSLLLFCVFCLFCCAFFLAGTEVDVACSGAWSTKVRWRPYMGATLEAAEAAQDETKGFRKFHVFWAWAWFFFGFNFFVSVMDLGRFGPL